MPKNAPPLRSGPPTPECRDQVLPSPTDHEGHCLQESVSKKAFLGTRFWAMVCRKKHTDKEFNRELINVWISCAIDEGYTAIVAGHRPAAQSTPADLDRVLRTICPVGAVPLATPRQPDAHLREARGETPWAYSPIVPRRAVEEAPDSSMPRLAVHRDFGESLQQTRRIILQGVCFLS